MKITFLGTGNAGTQNYYNTCFLIEEDGLFLTDTGCGDRLFSQIEKAGKDWHNIHDVFVSHVHPDHIGGAVVLIKKICEEIEEGIYADKVLGAACKDRPYSTKVNGTTGDWSLIRFIGNDDVIDEIRRQAEKELTKTQLSHLGHEVQMVAVRAGECRWIFGHRVTFFDVQSNKTKQYGYVFDLAANGDAYGTMMAANAEAVEAQRVADGSASGRTGDGAREYTYAGTLGAGKSKAEDAGKLVFYGDEPAYPDTEVFEKDAKWLIQEAFCLHKDRERLDPYGKGHATVRDNCENAERLGVKNLILVHTEEETAPDRKKLYTDEAKQYYSGNVFVPDDLEAIEIN